MKRNWKKLIVIILAILIIGILGNAFKRNGISSLNQAYTDTIGLCNVYYLSQIMTSIFVMLGAVIAVWQYLITSRTELRKYKNDRVEKAILLAEYYKNDILSNYTFLMMVFKDSGLYDIVKSAKTENLVNFDTAEMYTVFTTDQVNKIKKIINSKEFADCILKAVNEYGMQFNNSLLLKKTVADKETGEKKTVQMAKVDAVINEFMNGIICKTLNNMEYFAMNFTHEVADSTVVYQSLHQTYLEIVRILYINIAINNHGSNRLFTNVTELFNTWKAEKIRLERKKVEADRGNINKGTICES